jgi:rhodanese-related sulfurtransferase
MEGSVSRVLHPFLVLALVSVFAAGACSSSDTGTDGSDTGTEVVRSVAAAEAVGMLDSRTVIDVRSAEEYDAGHVAGAINIDVEASDFGAKIAALDPEDPYLVYCRSGRRSAIAADTMAEAGFTDIVDAGGLEPLADAGAPIE